MNEEVMLRAWRYWEGAIDRAKTPKEKDTAIRFARLWRARLKRHREG